MGLRIKKSFGGKNFRINISKSGIGYSYGVPGFTKTKLPSGRIRTTASIPGTGLSYVSETKGRSSEKNHSNNKPVKNAKYVQSDVIQDIDNVNELIFEESSQDEFLQSIKKAKKAHSFAIGFISLGIILLMSIVYAFGGVLFLGIGIGLYVYVKKKLKVNVEYEIKDETIKEYEILKDILLQINNSKKIWEIVGAAHNSNTKTHAGAERTVNREKTKFVEEKLGYIDMDEERILNIKLRKKHLLFLKDKLIIFKSGKIASVDYKKIKMMFSEQRFVEYSSLPKDATVVDHTWQFVNKNGQPDSRYSNNRQLPVCLYGRINIYDEDNSFNVELQMSNYEIYKRATKDIKEISRN